MKNILLNFRYVVLSVFLSSLVRAQAVRKIIQSPDKKITAKILSTGKWETPGSESKIEIRTAKGKLLCSNSYLSGDHEHGERVYQAQWTSDSKFLVFNSVSSGGHQPGHFLTRFWKRDINKIDVLDPYVGIWVTGNFKLKPPDSVTVVFSDRLPNGKIVDTLIKTVCLSQLVKRK